MAQSVSIGNRERDWTCGVIWKAVLILARDSSGMRTTGRRYMWFQITRKATQPPAMIRVKGMPEAVDDVEAAELIPGAGIGKEESWLAKDSQDASLLLHKKSVGNQAE